MNILPAKVNVLHFGDLLNLTCIVFGNRSDFGLIQYLWTVNDKLSNISSPILTIDYLTLESINQHGVYKCTAFGIDGVSIGESSSTLVAYAPHLTRQPSSLSISINNTVSFSCTAFGYPIPTIQWKRVSSTEGISTLEDINDFSINLPLNAYNNSISGSINETSTLRIDPFDYEDYGYYICIARLSSSDLSNCCPPNTFNISTQYNAISSIATLTGTAKICYVFIYNCSSFLQFLQKEV